MHGCEGEGNGFKWEAILAVRELRIRRALISTIAEPSLVDDLLNGRILIHPSTLCGVLRIDTVSI